MDFRLVAIVLYAALWIAGCVQGPSKPLTAEDRCVLLCQGNDAGHPCRDETVAEDCVTKCTAHITPLVDDCLTCVLTQSGWIAEACVCQEVDTFGNLDVTCKACAFTTYETECVTSTVCMKDTEMCLGFTLVEPTDPFCTPACGG